MKNMNEIYEDYLENNAEASEEVTAAYNELRKAFDNYVDVVTEFKWKCGFKYAMKLNGKEVE